MGKLTPKQRRVLECAAAATENEPTTPTQIGQACGKAYPQASSWAVGALNWLRDNNLVVYRPGGKCWATDRGHRALEQTS